MISLQYKGKSTNVNEKRNKEGNPGSHMDVNPNMEIIKKLQSG